MTKDRISNTYEDDPKNLKLNAFNLFRENVFNDACTSSEKCQVRSLLLQGRGARRGDLSDADCHNFVNI